jgi:hypothetical protein
MICIVVVTVLVFIASSTITSAIKLNDSNRTADADLSTSGVDEVYIGKIKVWQVSPFVDIDPVDDLELRASSRGREFNFKIDYYVNAEGGYYDLAEAWMNVYLNGVRIKNKDDYCAETDEETEEGSFIFNHVCSPGDHLEFELKGKDSDYVGTRVTRDEKTVDVDIIEGVADLDVEKDFITGSIHCDTTGQVEINLLNRDAELDLYWKYTDVRADDGGSFTPTFGGGNSLVSGREYGPIESDDSKEVKVSITNLPQVTKLEGSKTINCDIDFENADDSGDKVTVQIQIAVLSPRVRDDVKSSSFNYQIFIQKILQLFPMMQKLLT